MPVTNNQFVVIKSSCSISDKIDSFKTHEAFLESEGNTELLLEINSYSEEIENRFRKNTMSSDNDSDTNASEDNDNTNTNTEDNDNINTEDNINTDDNTNTEDKKTD